MELSKKIILGTFLVAIVVTIVVNLIKIENFFGAYYIDLYVIVPLLLIQIMSLLLLKKAVRFVLILNIVVALIMLFVLYKLITNN